MDMHIKIYVDVNIYVWRLLKVRTRSKRNIDTSETLEQEAVSFKVADPRVRSVGPIRVDLIHESEEINSRRVKVARPVT